jgi:bla regulator protein blaR1
MTHWLYDTLLATTALLALVLIFRKPVARHFGAAIAYSLWLLPAARLFMPSLTREISKSNSPRETFIASLPAEIVGTPHALAGPAIDWTVILVSIWLGGAALLFVLQTIRYCIMRDNLLSDAVVLDQIGNITVIECSDVQGPLAFGLIRRYIAVPHNFSRIFAPRERELALAHELAHHRAGDLFANLAAFLFVCLQWFNPLVWIAWSAFRLDQEAACDARVLAGADVATRQSYGRALARIASEGTSSFAMALNSPHTIIERLRRLMMKDPSNGRRIAGRLAILAATAIALPLTATVVPVFAEDAPKAEDGKAPAAEKRIRKMIIIKDSDGKPVTVDVKGDADTPFVKTIEKNGKTIVLRSNKELSKAEVDKMVAEAGSSLNEADKLATEIENKGGRTVRRIVVHHNSVIHDGKGEDMQWSSSGDGAVAIDGKNLVPDINIAEVHANCKDGQLVTANGFDSKDKATIAISICGKGNAKLARSEAISGLKEAQKQLKDDKDIPDGVRKSVVESLQLQIDRLEKQLAEGKDEG